MIYIQTMNTLLNRKWWTKFEFNLRMSYEYFTYKKK